MKYKKERKDEYDGTVYLSAKKMKQCRKEIQYSDNTIRTFIETVAIPALKDKSFTNDIYKGHMILLILNYCTTQPSESGLKSNYNVGRTSTLKNIKYGAKILAWFIRNNIWYPKIVSDFSKRSSYSYENFGNVGGKDFRYITWIIDSKSTKTKKFKRTNSMGKQLNGRELYKYYYDKKIKTFGKKFIGLRSSDNKWRGCSKSCYPSGKFKETSIIKEDPYCKVWLTLMNERDCIATPNPVIGSSIRNLLEFSDDYYNREDFPKIEATKLNYPPKITRSYSEEIKKRIQKIEKWHKKFRNKTIKIAWEALYNNNPGIVSKNKEFRTDDDVFHSDLIQIAMEMQNIDNEGRDKEFMLKLYNGELDFDKSDIISEGISEGISDYNEYNDEDQDVVDLLNDFEKTEHELINGLIKNDDIDSDSDIDAMEEKERKEEKRKLELEDDIDSDSDIDAMEEKEEKRKREKFVHDRMKIGIQREKNIEKRRRELEEKQTRELEEKRTVELERRELEEKQTRELERRKRELERRKRELEEKQTRELEEKRKREKFIHDRMKIGIQREKNIEKRKMELEEKQTRELEERRTMELERGKGELKEKRKGEKVAGPFEDYVNRWFFNKKPKKKKTSEKEKRPAVKINIINKKRGKKRKRDSNIEDEEPKKKKRKGSIEKRKKNKRGKKRKKRKRKDYDDDDDSDDVEKPKKKKRRIVYRKCCGNPSKGHPRGYCPYSENKEDEEIPNTLVQDHEDVFIDSDSVEYPNTPTQDIEFIPDEEDNVSENVSDLEDDTEEIKEIIEEGKKNNILQNIPIVLDEDDEEDYNIGTPSPTINIQLSTPQPGFQFEYNTDWLNPNF